MKAKQNSENPLERRTKMSFLCNGGPQIYVSKIPIKDAQVLITLQSFSQSRGEQHM